MAPIRPAGGCLSLEQRIPAFWLVEGRPACYRERDASSADASRSEHRSIYSALGHSI